MKIIYLAMILLIAASALPAADSFQVNPDKSKVRWEGKKVVGGHHGYVKIKSGKLTFDGVKLKGGEFLIDLTTIADEDLTDPATNAKLINHLKSEDFFNAVKYPESKLKITYVKPLINRKKEESNYEITADLTIRDKTNTIKFPALIKHRGDKVEAYSFIRIDRTKWDIRYNSGNFFRDIGDKAIMDDVDFNVSIFANKAVVAD